MSQRRPTSRGQHGWSLIEAAVAISITTILVSSAVPSFQQMLARRLVEGRTDELRNNLLSARSEAISLNTPVLVSFQTAALQNCYVVQTGRAGDCTCSNTSPTQCVNGAREIKTVLIPANEALSLKANVKSLSFDPTRGTASMGTVTLAATQHQAISLVVNKTGRIRLCSTDANLPGLQSCNAVSR